MYTSSSYKTKKMLLSFKDLSFPSITVENTKHKFKRLIPKPNSTFIGCECKICSTTNILFSHSSRQQKCRSCSYVLTNPKGGKYLKTQRINIFKRLSSY